MALESSGTILYVAKISYQSIWKLLGGTKILQTDRQTHTHTHTHTHTQTHTHTNTHTHTPSAHFMSFFFKKK